VEPRETSCYARAVAQAITTTPVKLLLTSTRRHKIHQRERVTQTIGYRSQGCDAREPKQLEGRHAAPFSIINTSMRLQTRSHSYIRNGIVMVVRLRCFLVLWRVRLVAEVCLCSCSTVPCSGISFCFLFSLFRNLVFSCSVLFRRLVLVSGRSRGASCFDVARIACLVPCVGLLLQVLFFSCFAVFRNLVSFLFFSCFFLFCGLVLRRCRHRPKVPKSAKKVPKPL